MGTKGTVSIHVVCGYHVISLRLLSTLLGTHNPELIGLENKVLRVVLGWDPLHGLRLAKIEVKKISGQSNPINEWAYT